ncbi:MAG: lipid-A-disaccharide synthase [Bacteroidota bacterium]
MKYYIIAGEASGDLHGAALVKGLRQVDAAANIRCWGGDKMEAAGAVLVRHYQKMAFMGFLEVVKNIGPIRRNFIDAKADILQFQPDVLILIDYPGFNLRMAKWAKKQQLKVFYYISPQIWAWNTGRVRIVKQFIDRMFVILPFEKAFYAKHQVEVDFLGHPLMDVIPRFEGQKDFCKHHHLDERPLVALLPGSRQQEIRLMLPTMLQLIDRYPDFQFAIAAAPSIPLSFYKSLCKGQTVPLIQGNTYDLLQQADSALVTSGTATLEAALFGTPQIVCYKGNPISYLLARQLIKVDYISLVNLILNRPLVTELIQNDFHLPRLTAEFDRLQSPNFRQTLASGYAELRNGLGEAGAGKRAAEQMFLLLSQ